MKIFVDICIVILAIAALAFLGLCGLFWWMIRDIERERKEEDVS